MKAKESKGGKDNKESHNINKNINNDLYKTLLLDEYIYIKPTHFTYIYGNLNQSL